MVNPLADLLRAAADRAGGSVVADRRNVLPLADAVRRAADLAEDVSRAAGCPRPVVAVVLPTSLDAVTHLLAAILGDCTVTFLDPADDQRADAVLDGIDPDVVVDGSGVHPRRRRLDQQWAPGYVARSSGSTGGPPKGVLTSWECLADFAPYGAEALRVDDGSVWAEPNHPTYDLAITNWVVALMAGASLHVSGALTDRLRPLALVTRTGATHVRLAPRYVDLAIAEQVRGTPCNLRVWASGGDRLSAQHAKQVLGLGAALLVNTYGTSETAGFASAAAYAPDEDLRTAEGAVSIGDGRLGPWRVEVGREVLQGVPTDVLGIRSPHLGTGYLFGGHGQEFPRWEPGRVVTGDLGRQVGSDLFCFGRAGRVVKRSGSFVNLDDVDAVLRQHRGLTSYTVVTRDGELVTLVEGERDVLVGIRDGLRSLVAPEVLPDEMVRVARLPRLGNGKPDQAGAQAIARGIAESGPGRPALSTPRGGRGRPWRS